MKTGENWPNGELIQRGSVKDIYTVPGKGDEQLYFSYSDRYSVFDWGEMPDELEGKGEALSYMAWTFFKLLGDPVLWQKFSLEVEGPMEAELLSQFRERGVPHHALARPADQGLLVKKIQVLHPHFDSSKGAWDYREYTENPPENALIPLEFIFRFGVPQGSSLLKRLSPDYTKSLGLSSPPEAGARLEREIIEMSTKLESTDRYLHRTQVQEIAGLQNGEYERLDAYTRLISRFVKSLFESRGIEVWDGKIEMAFKQKRTEQGERDFMMVDSVGPDELRLMLPGQTVPLSKEILRQYYRGTEWAKNVELAKKMAQERQISEWKSLCLEELGSRPEPLPVAVKEAVSTLYLSLANELAMFAGDELPFPQADSLGQVAEELVAIPSAK